MMVYPCLGRDDYWPPGHHPTRPTQPSFYKRLADLFQSWLYDEARDSFAQSGYYSRIHAPRHLRIVVLNTNFLLETHVSSSQQDPGEHWSWLELELIRARKLGQKVFLVMSSPPGVFENAYHVPGRHWFHPHHNRVYINLVRKYKDVIKGQFAGHHHSDTFRVFFSKRERPVSWMLLSPAVGPRNLELAPEVVTYNNPGIRLYMYDTDTLDVLDYTQFFLNLTAANVQERATWQIAYTFTTFYQVPNISLYSFRLLLSRFQEDRVIFSRYYQANSLYVHEGLECDDFCMRYHTCAIQNIDYSAFFECLSAADATSMIQKWEGEPLRSRISMLRPCVPLILLVIVCGILLLMHESV